MKSFSFTALVAAVMMMMAAVLVNAAPLPQDIGRAIYITATITNPVFSYVEDTTEEPVSEVTVVSEPPAATYIVEETVVSSPPDVQISTAPTEEEDQQQQQQSQEEQEQQDEEASTPSEDANAGSGNGSGATSSKFWGVTYSPYNTDGSCPDLSTVAEQLKKVAGVAKNVRLYSTDCSQLELVLQAIAENNIGLGVYAGIWISHGAERAATEIDEFVAAAAKYPGRVKGVSVGNEVLAGGLMSEADLIGYISKTRAAMAAAGLSGIPVSTTDTDSAFTSSLAAAVDEVEVNIHVIFDSHFTSVDASIQSVVARANAVQAKIGSGKQVRIGETGWASQGTVGAVPLTLSNEMVFARNFKCAIAKTNYQYFYFEAKDSLWKTGESAAEQSFGLFDANYVPKFDFSILDTC